MNRHALLSVGLLLAGVVAAVPGCSDDGGTGEESKAGESSSAGRDAVAGENTGGTGSVAKPSGGEGGVIGSLGGNGGSPLVEGGTSSVGAGAGGVAAGGVATGGAGGEGGAAPLCVVSNVLGNLGLMDGDASEVVEAPVSEAWQGSLVAPSPWWAKLSVELYDGFDPFADGIKNVSNHVLAGPDLNYETCGLCVRIVAQNEETDATQFFFVTGGKISLTNVDGRITGIASNLTFEEVTIDEQSYHSTPVVDGCETSIASVGFDASIPQGGAGGAGGAGN